MRRPRPCPSDCIDSAGGVQRRGVEDLCQVRVKGPWSGSSRAVRRLRPVVRVCRPGAGGRPGGRHHPRSGASVSERATRIELASSVWKTEALPLSYARTVQIRAPCSTARPADPLSRSSVCTEELSGPERTCDRHPSKGSRVVGHAAAGPGGPPVLPVGPRAEGVYAWPSARRPAAPRGVAQVGSASGLGPEGRRFESCHPDSQRRARRWRTRLVPRPSAADDPLLRWPAAPTCALLRGLVATPLLCPPALGDVRSSGCSWASMAREARCPGGGDPGLLTDGPSSCGTRVNAREPQ